MMLTLVALVAAAVFPAATIPARPHGSAAGTYNGRANELKVRSPRLEDGGLAIDGKLDEAQWAKAALLTGFSQFAPNDGVAADDSTEVLVWYSATAIHFGIRAFEKHGAPRARLADRDKIATDDHIQILLGTFNDGRQASVFAVNPFGVQADGTIVESNQSRGGGFGGVTLARDPADLSADYVFESKGMLTPDGYVIEVRIPFKSLKYQSTDVQSWGLNALRIVQHSGHEDSWAPARRSASSFLSQSGVLEGLTDLRRGLVVDMNPEVTQRTVGGTALPGATPGWAYDRRRPDVGGNARWGITNNITLSATANPDFSQIESDAGQLAFDPRQSLFFAEKRPFFLEGTEQFSVPHSLIYTRRVVQPLAATKLTGKVSGTSIALLSAIDDEGASASRADNPFFNMLRVQRDIGKSKLGIAYTDRVDGGNYNRVADVDGTYLFGGVYSFQGQYAQSYTKRAGAVTNAPLWHAGVNRTGKHYSASYSLDGVHENFITQSGYISRPGVVNVGADQRFTMYGAPGSLFEAVTFNPGYFSTWRYQAFVHQGDAIEKKWHFNLSSTLRGGWNGGIGYFNESFGFDPVYYSKFKVQGPNGEVLPFNGVGRIPNSEYYFSLNTPAGAKLSANAFYLWGRDENFYEWAQSDIIIATYGLTYRPTDKLRANATYNIQSYNRRSDGSIVGNNRIPRLKLEYQIARPIFVRLVGEFDSYYQDALRDEGGTGRPLLVNGSLVPRSSSTSFRGDFLFSYQPNPGTVVFLGYGAGYADTRSTPDRFEFPSSLRFRGYNRSDDAFFVKASYLIRL